MVVLSFFVWLVLVLGAGWLAFPVSRRIFEGTLPDAGLAVGRVLFLAIWTLLAFYAGQIGISVAWGAGIYAPLAVAGLVLWRRDRVALAQTLRANGRAIRRVETVFVAVFLGFFVLRGFWSDTNGSNGEKGMDSALIASLTRAQHLPPPNPYAAGAQLQSYYYFGHLETALLTRASATTTRWSYNWMCATLPALCFAALFPLGAALTGSSKGGALVTAAVLLGGTLEPIYQWLNEDAFWRARFLGLEPFNISRVLPFTINEFPWFTFNQADLHAHYFALPFALAQMALAWSLYRTKKPAVALLSALLLGAQIMTNTWDFPIYWLLVAGAMLCSGQSAGTPLPRRKWALWARQFALALGVAVVALGVAAPFLLRVQSVAAPPQPLPQPGSPLREWLLLWGPATLGWWNFAALVIFRRQRFAPWALGLVGAGVLWAAFSAQWKVPFSLVLPVFGNVGWVLPLVIFSAALALWGIWTQRENARFLCVLALCGLLALVWSETTWAGLLGDARHAGIDDYKRQDTVFKFGLQAWMLWGTASAAGAWLALERGSARLRIAAKVVATPLVAVMVAGNLAFMLMRMRLPQQVLTWHDGQPKWRLLFDGWDAWAHLAPPEKEAAQWLQENVLPGENIVEAEKPDYSDFSPYTRYAHATGIATVIGPQAHTFFWSPANAPVGRGPDGRRAKIQAEFNETVRRKADARASYSPIDIQKRGQLLKRYGVKYLIWGELERAQYGDEFVYNLASSLDIAAQFGDPKDPHSVIIFRVQ